MRGRDWNFELVAQVVVFELVAQVVVLNLGLMFTQYDGGVGSVGGADLSTHVIKMAMLAVLTLRQFNGSTAVLVVLTDSSCHNTMVTLDVLTL